MAGKERESSHSEQTTVEPKEQGSRGGSTRQGSKESASTPRAATKESGPKASSSAPANIGSAPPGTWIDMARAGYFSDPHPKSKLDQLADKITDSISSLQEAFATKPTPWKFWGKAPTIRKEWYYLKGEQKMPLGFNRWEPFSEHLQSLLTTGHDCLHGRGHGFLGDVETDEGEEAQQVFLAHKIGTSTEIVGFDPLLWAPKDDERPDSELLKAGKARLREGHFMSLTKERTLVEEYYSTRWWSREEKPTLRVVLLVEETVDSAVQELSPELMSNPQYVIRVLNPAGLAVIGFQKHELEKRNVRDLKFRFEDIWRGRGEACYITDGREVHQDEELKRLVKQNAKTKRPVDVKVMYLTEEQAKLKREGMGAIIKGQFADLAREGYFGNMMSYKSTYKGGGSCCVAS
mmetsp:Transcript_54219/g.126192  ORF Transcript_54219/g.126192 Transcript_54219/m.126192 type:complete len:405 (-) Transcript_54219:228-1442(-)